MYRATSGRQQRLVALFTIVMLLFAALAPRPAAAATSAADFRNTMRSLWEDHVFWTRLYIVSVAGNLPDKDATAQRLLQNQTDIGNAIKPFYGDEAGNKLTALLRDHILGAADLLAAAKAGDNAKVQAGSQKWYANANDIAAFLNGANPKAWALPDMQMAMKMHLDQTLQEATDRLQGNYAADIKDYAVVRDHILGMADAVSAGIISQFPDKFDKSAAPDLQLGMRKLWEDHIQWTRLYIVSAAANLPDKDLTAQRLLQNQDDIGNAVKPFYGDAAGAKLTALLRDHILGAASLIGAAQANDNAKVQAASSAWYANANDIAAFLSAANPKSWPLATMQSGMKMHLDMTLAEATARLKGDFAGDIKDYDGVRDHILGLADTLTTGIQTQFPQGAAGAASAAKASGAASLPNSGQPALPANPALAAAIMAGGVVAVTGLAIRRRLHR